jgi:glycosyltransferase involved in cell wall biosynthesis
VASSWISLAPIHTGGGTRLKILEAMGLRTPVVATTKGAEGLEVQSGEHLLMADTPEDFAKTIVELCHNRGLRRLLTDNAYDLVRKRYDWPVILPQFLELVEKVGRRPSFAAPLSTGRAARSPLPPG